MSLSYVGKKAKKYVPRVLVDDDLKDKSSQIGTTKMCYVLELIRKQNLSEIYQSTIIHM